MNSLPQLKFNELAPTRDYLQGAAHAIGALQRAFLPKHTRDWQYGLEVSMHGITTQTFDINGVETRAILDLVKMKVRLGDTNWSLYEYAGPELLNNIAVWLESQNTKVVLEKPDFAVKAAFDKDQAKAYADALWWIGRQFRAIKAALSEGVTSPVLLYPHHFDLALNWFPWDDERQLSIGWSTGDETIHVPYIYLTAYPEPTGFTDIKLPVGAYWQKDGFSGAILPYAVLQSADKPDELLQNLVSDVFTTGRKLLG